jgi:peptidoglycan/xylan/chitin deacetylase (PgdA/CDA1 family)
VTAIHIRFDIDTITCIEKGVPRLLDMAQRLGVRFTFFVNLGRSIDRREVFYGSPSKTVGNVLGEVQKIGALKKLGLIDILRTVIVNPEIGLGHRDILMRLVDEGHELGLHGGGNHGTWQRRGKNANSKMFSSWIDEVMSDYRAIVPAGGGFASPGAVANSDLPYVLQDKGFVYSSDDFKSQQIYRHTCGLWEIPVTACYGTVPLIEHFKALGHDADFIVTQANKWAKNTPLKTFYGHPVWEGYRDADLFECILNSWLDDGYRICPYGEAISSEKV